MNILDIQKKRSKERFKEKFKETNFPDAFKLGAKKLKDTEEIEFALIGEAGEIIEILKKMKFHKHRKLEKLEEHLIEELGDFFWYYFANLRLNKKYDFETCLNNVYKQVLLFEECKQIGTEKRIQDYNKDIINLKLGEYFADILHFVKTEYNKNFDFDFFKIIIYNIKKVTKRYG